MSRNLPLAIVDFNAP